ncbi:exonuclease domain-containing protein [Nocardiopsis salina]|uniref:exonuclease domain-containing protein n=1 Tax=Nocardiopsis salina TaxID=245836 RepID=UPI0003491BD5|nr:exonuclease domain-containing protein [Nocardiopsis salina]
MSASWYTRPLAAFDVETTGLDVTADRIVTAALWRIDPTSGTKEPLTWIIDPGVPIPPEAAGIHGYTDERVRAEGTPAVEAVPAIGAALEKVAADGLPLVVYNAPYDLGILHHEFVRNTVRPEPLSTLHVVDPLVLDKQMDPYRRGGRKLTDVCAHHGVPLAADEAHGAAADALAAGRLAWRLGSSHPELGTLAPAELHDSQVRWKADQAASFQAYLRRTRDPEAVIDGTWPYVGA